MTLLSRICPSRLLTYGEDVVEPTIASRVLSVQLARARDAGLRFKSLVEEGVYGEVQCPHRPGTFAASVWARTFARECSDHDEVVSAIRGGVA